MDWSSARRAYALLEEDRAWLERKDTLWRACLAGVRLSRAAAMTRLGHTPEAPTWPRDPFSLQPIRLVATADGHRVELAPLQLKGETEGETQLLLELAAPIEIPR